MSDHLLRHLYSAGPSASCSNQSETFFAVHDTWKFQTKLRSIEVLALISTSGISTVANDNSPLLDYISPSASDESGLIYVQGAPKKSNPLGKILYLWNCSRFFHQIYSFYRRGFRPYILQILLK